ncbi:MAG: M15 family metallopeptidase, partial [Alphaproteobacteria bacterium]|nr:M15 family metallopeptidase [Rickettsiales bacterium]
LFTITSLSDSTYKQNSILSKLDPDLVKKIVLVLENCTKRGINMVPFSGLRSPMSQGTIWKQGRKKSDIDKKIEELKKEECDFLASCIENSPAPAQGNIVSNAIPGLSWHQLAAAVDCMWFFNGQIVNFADESRIINGKEVQGYYVYAQIVVDHGLTSGGFFQNIKDYPHAQLCPEGNPLIKYGSLKKINNIIAKKQKR